MKHIRRFLSIGCLALLLLPGGKARAEFSEGISRLQALGRSGGRIEAQMTLEPVSLLSIGKEGMRTLRALFDGLTIGYASQQGDTERWEQWSLTRGEQPLATAQLFNSQEGAAFLCDLLAQGVAAPDEDTLLAALGMSAPLRTLFALRNQEAQATAPLATATPGQAYAMQVTVTQQQLELLCALAAPQMPDGVAGALEGMLGRWTLAQPIQLDFATSDAGTLTRLKADARIARQGEAPWTVKLDVRPKGGNVDADLELTQDKQNTLSIALSIDSTDTKATRSADAQKSVKVRLNGSGKLGGYQRTFRLQATLSNSYRENERGELVETLKNTLTLGYTDKDPAVRMLSLGDVSLSLKERGEAISGAGAADVRLNETIEAALTLGGKTVLEGTATVQIAGCERQTVAWPEETVSLDALSPDALAALPQLLAQRIYPLLEEALEAQ